MSGGHSLRAVPPSEPMRLARLRTIADRELELRHERAEAVFAALEDGVPHSKIAEALRCSRQAVGQYVAARRAS